MNLLLLHLAWTLHVLKPCFIPFPSHFFYKQSFKNHNTATNLAAYTCSIRYMYGNTCTCIGGYTAVYA